MENKSEARIYPIESAVSGVLQLAALPDVSTGGYHASGEMFVAHVRDVLWEGSICEVAREKKLPCEL